MGISFRHSNIFGLIKADNCKQDAALTGIIQKIMEDPANCKPEYQEQETNVNSSGAQVHAAETRSSTAP
ncbi:hypothetical protein [Paenibacillus favisporus]|uniref:hypothetical protein n=1 Tax=Paenibacillus favisporus TaxID=221028 RepID=UPI0013D440DA|nr:hypothetical protein [Paenibacillus favisporus]